MLDPSPHNVDNVSDADDDVRFSADVALGVGGPKVDVDPSLGEADVQVAAASAASVSVKKPKIPLFGRKRSQKNVQVCVVWPLLIVLSSCTCSLRSKG